MSTTPAPPVVDSLASQRTFLGHPAALYVLFFSELWERFSYYGMRALLVFYMTKQLMYSDAHAYDMYSSYTTLVYATPVIGGLIADRILGYRRAIVLGGVLMAIGHFAMAFENEYAFFAALSFLIVGNGFFKPNISSLVGQLYPAGDPRRDGAFTIFYMGINTGALLAPLVCGTIGETVGWSWGFGLAGIGMVVGLLSFALNQRLLGDHGYAPVERPRPAGVDSAWIVPVVAVLCVPLIMALVNLHLLVGWVLVAIGVVVLGGLLITAFMSEKSERERLFVVLVLIFFSVLFWAFFEQAGSSLSLFTDRNVDRHFMGFEIPASTFQAVNPSFIIILGPVFAMLWTWLGKLGREPSTPLKFSLGLFQIAGGFMALVIGAQLSATNGMTSMIFLILAYFLHTTGELCTSPVGLSMVTKLSPAKMVGVVMGAWFLSSAFAQYLGGIVAKLTGGSEETGAAITRVHEVSGALATGFGGLGSPAQGTMSSAGTALAGAVGQANLPPTVSLPLYSTVFWQITLVAAAAGVLCLVLVPLLRKWMHGVN